MSQKRSKNQIRRDRLKLRKQAGGHEISGDANGGNQFGPGSSGAVLEPSRRSKTASVGSIDGSNDVEHCNKENRASQESLNPELEADTNTVPLRRASIPKAESAGKQESTIQTPIITKNNEKDGKDDISAETSGHTGTSASSDSAADKQIPAKLFHEKSATEHTPEIQTKENNTGAEDAGPRDESGRSEETDYENNDTEATADNKSQVMDIFSRLQDSLSTESASSEIQDPFYSQYKSIFRKFEPQAETQLPVLVCSDHKSASSGASSSDESADEESGKKSMSKRQRRLRDKIPMSVLKASSARPQAVEWHDADAPDPYMAVFMKTALNHVPVPLHWQQKKDYLSSKRGVERPPFELPKFIENTGIAEMRNHDPESLKKLQRDRVQPKMGRLDIDYQKLHDAFFKYQTRPRMLGFGEVYSEGREKTDQHNHDVALMRPGKISRLLRSAVGMPESELVAPPWISVMQELGKPPSYLNLLIPGLDIEYTNLGYKVQYGEKGKVLGLLKETWGALEDGEESEVDLEDLESEEEEEEEAGESAIAESNSRLVSHNSADPGGAFSFDSEQPTRVEIEEYSKVKKPLSAETTTNSGGSLYKILKEKSGDGLGASKGGKLQYEIEEKKESTPKRSKPTKHILEDTGDFRF